MEQLRPHHHLLLRPWLLLELPGHPQEPGTPARRLMVGIVFREGTAVLLLPNPPSLVPRTLTF